MEFHLERHAVQAVPVEEREQSSSKAETYSHDHVGSEAARLFYERIVDRQAYDLRHQDLGEHRQQGSHCRGDDDAEVVA